MLERPDAPEALLTLVLAAFPEVGQEQDAALLRRHAREATSDFVRMNAANALAGLEERTGTREGHAWYVELLGDPEEDAAVKRAVLGAIERTGDATYLPLLAAALRSCAPEQSEQAAALARAISMLLGRKLHGPDFGTEAAR